MKRCLGADWVVEEEVLAVLERTERERFLVEEGDIVRFGCGLEEFGGRGSWRL